MRKLTKIAGVVLAGIALLGLLLVGLVSTVAFLIGGSSPEPDSFTHEVEYRIEFRTNGSLNNTELLVPYPEDQRFRSIIDGNTSKVSIVNEMNASLSIVETSRGGMLRLDIGEFRPENRSERFETDRRIENETGELEVARGNITGLAEYSSYDLTIRAKYNRTIDTRNGLTNEPHLRSTDAECAGPRETGCATTEAFVSYNASNDTHTELNVRLAGRNSWWDWGWSGNEYRQSFYNSFYDDDNLAGSQNQWVTLTGKEEQGDGNYRQ